MNASVPVRLITRAKKAGDDGGLNCRIIPACVQRLCSYAINDLLNNGAGIVTLGACDHSAFLYERLGFKRCFNNAVMKFEF